MQSDELKTLAKNLFACQKQNTARRDAAGTRVGMRENCIGKFTVQTNEPACAARNNAQEALRVCVCKRERA